MKTITSTFRSSEPALQDLLRQIHEGKIQLPDFQRGWVWDDDHIRDLIASVSMAHPIGAVMVLQTGGDVQFQPRPLEGADEAAGTEPESLILDGQQRMTSLYLSLYSKKPVKTRVFGKEAERYYYLDIDKCLDPQSDRIDAVLSIPGDKRVTSDFGRKVEVDLNDSSQEYEYGLFPLACVYHYDKFSEWRMGYAKHFQYDPEKIARLDRFEIEVLEHFRRYRVPVIELLRGTPKEAVCHVFEKLNTGGVTLTVFELLTAIFASQNFNLRQDWEERKRLLHTGKQNAVLKDVDNTLFLQAVTLMATYLRSLRDPAVAVSCKSKDILKLTLEEYLQLADRVRDGFLEAARFLHEQKIFDTRMLPYPSQLVPLAVVSAMIGDRFRVAPIRQMVARWFWCAVFGELYGAASERRINQDLPEILSWIDGGAEPKTVREAGFHPVRLLSMQTRGSAAYKGMISLLLKEGAEDWMSGSPVDLDYYFDEQVDIHHIFPRAYCVKNNYPDKKWNSVVNKTPLSSQTNKVLGGKAPSQYLRTLANKHPDVASSLDRIIKTHHVNPSLLRTDDFDAFFLDRAKRLLDLIEKAMGKTVSGRNSQEVIREFGGPLI